MTPTLLLVAVMAATPTAPATAPPEASAQLHVELQELGSDVWGGDGENLPAIWTLMVQLTVHNTGDQPVLVTGGSFVLPLPGDDVRGHRGGSSVEIAPGASAIVVLERHLSLPQLYTLREDVQGVAERIPRRISGQLDFEIAGQPRYTPFTVTGRYRGVFD
jgi:hypothetical protein